MTNRIFLFDSEKGGVGKSTFCKAFIQHLINIHVPFKLLEADLSNRDVLDTYSDLEGSETIHLSNDARIDSEADRIFAAGKDTNVVVNFPANIAAVFDKWLGLTDILDIQKKHDVQFVKFFLVTQDSLCLRALERSLDQWGDKIIHVVVQNLDTALPETYEAAFANAKELSALIKKHKVAVIQMERLSYRARDIVSGQQLRFDRAIADDSPLGILDRQRVKVWLDDCYKQMESSGVCPEGQEVVEEAGEKPVAEEKVAVPAGRSAKGAKPGKA